MKSEVLRKKYQKFIYNSFDFKLKKKGLEICFDFKIEPDIQFSPKVLIVGINEKEIKKVGERALKNLIFNLGMIEALSYWKATCSPKIEILAGNLNKEQIRWWRNLIFKGMGQFFFENKINFLEKNFLKIESFGEKFERFEGELNENKILVPVGGGKDSVVTIEYLKKMKKDLVLFCLNPNKNQKKIIEISGIRKKVFVKREIDKKLLELNQRGFLNGHTPFTAYLCFLSVLVAVLKDCKFIAFSNEKSSNEGNVKYLGKIINHQYSKSEEFEKKFRFYSKKYLAKRVECFSLLRNLYELEISALFSQFPQYFDAFLSCNVAFQTKSGTKKPIKKWCGECPKCLFVFTSLYPFIGERVIKIFGKNLFEDKKLLPLMLQLIGKKKFKPFECVGTKKESFLAFKLSLRRWKKENKKLPFLLKRFQTLYNLE
jgi:7-cyano-7-deazaguanine synthase in queuosine biosynthesis